MINGKQFKRIFGILLFVLFGFGFNSSFGATQILEVGDTITPSFGNNNSEGYTQTLNEDGTFYSSLGDISNPLIVGYQSLWGGYFRYYRCEKNGHIGLCRFYKNNASNNKITYSAVIWNYNTYKNTYPGISISNCLTEKPENDTWNCYFKDFDDFGEEYKGKLSGIYRDNSSNKVPGIIFEELNEIVMLNDNTSNHGSGEIYPGDTQMSFTGFDTSLVKRPNFIIDIPSNSSTVIYTNSDLDKVISYYETRYNWDESMCYVGTFDTGSSYGTPGVDFVSGTGNSVFGLYHELYNGYGNNIIKNVGSWINVRLINYSEWFYNNDNIRYLVSYNGPDSNISLYYTGLTFPFANKPVALYFMASNLYDGYSRESTQGEEMSYYCYSKLNYQQIKDGDINFDTIKQMVSTGINERLDTYYNYHISNNSGSYITPSSGSFWDAFGTGFEDTDLDLDTTFSNFFDKITSVFQNYSPNYSTGIIPDWILYPLIFLILFRIMKH